MLLRLRVQGFKNLRDVDLRLGPVTCLVGQNGVGKSNIFDAIQFLRLLTQEEINRAAQQIRQPQEGGYGALELLSNRDPGTKLFLGAEMLVPTVTTDDFGVTVEPSATLLRYEIELGYSQDESRLVLRSERLDPLPKKDARDTIGFLHSRGFRDSVVVGRRQRPFISADEDGRIQLHQDGGSRGRPVPAGVSPRSVLGGTGTQEYPTVVAARREMASWHSLRLEPSSLRSPDHYGEASQVDEQGRHLAAALHSLGLKAGDQDKVCVAAANSLAQLVPSVQAVRVHDDETRQQRTVEVKMRGSSLWLSPRSLSDGTLRFLALVVMEMDADASRVLCVEEPENGIHPTQVDALVRVLRDYAVDPNERIDRTDNPARQVILNSHSPTVLGQLRPQEVLFVDSYSDPIGSAARIRPVKHQRNWRGCSAEGCVPIDDLQHLVGSVPRLDTTQPGLWDDNE